jgi:hypothetical protein
VLSACRSHVGRLVRGEGLLSLSRAFIHAGARAVVATVWTVPDRETAWLMQRLYRGLRDGLAPDDALRQAQLQALGSGGAQADPGTWAAFLVVGDAHTPVLDAPLRSAPSTLTLVAGALVLVGAAAAAMRGRWFASPHAESRGR